MISKPSPALSLFNVVSSLCTNAQFREQALKIPGVRPDDLRTPHGDQAKACLVAGIVMLLSEFLPRVLMPAHALGASIFKPGSTSVEQTLRGFERTPPTTEAYWSREWAKTLGNAVNGNVHAALVGFYNARIAMPQPEDQPNFSLTHWYSDIRPAVAQALDTLGVKSPVKSNMQIAGDFNWRDVYSFGDTIIEELAPLVEEARLKYEDEGARAKARREEQERVHRENARRLDEARKLRHARDLEAELQLISGGTFQFGAEASW